METPTHPKRHSFGNYWTKFRSLFKFLFKSKRPFKLTRGGWIFILYTIGVGAGAINTGNNLLYLIFGIFLGLILASGVLSDLTLWGVSVETLFPKSTRAGEPLYIPLLLTNTKRRFPSLSIRVEVEANLDGASISGQAHCPSIERKATASALVVVHPARRGVLRLQKIKLSTRFPFGLLRKSWTLPQTDPETVLIHPALVPIKGMSVLKSFERLGAAVNLQKKGEGIHPYGIREWEPADNPKRIHWKASAKRGVVQSEYGAEWLVKEMEQEHDDEVAVWWPESSFFQNLDDSEIETFISFVASLVVEWEVMKKATSLLVAKGAGADRLEAAQLWYFLSTVKPREMNFDSPHGSQSAGHLTHLYGLWKNER
jgi:uncharacterized protein (DUF58 family)